MNVLVVTHDLSVHNAHLMPWRTVCEVVERVRKKGCKSQLVSLGDRRGTIIGAGIPENTVSITKDYRSLEKGLRDVVEQGKCELILWPVVWREPNRRIKIVSRCGIPVIGYFPGGVYRLGDALYAARRIGLHNALPYLAEAIWPKRIQLMRWKRRGIRYLIAMTSFTAGVTVSKGWSERLIAAIPPGRDDIKEAPVTDCLPDEFVEWWNDRPFYMFAGPPSGIRGIYELLASFERAAEVNKDICLVCLFRSDAPLESERIAEAIDKMRCGERVYTVWESLGKLQLEAFMSKCHGVVLPFVAVPSEIPLAIIEAMRYEKPVITTQTGGSGDFVSSFGVSVPLGGIGMLADIMIRLITDKNYYIETCDATRVAYAGHPTWNEMADQWIECCTCILEGSVNESLGGRSG